jgi:predicted GNAT family N-acyltransferase
LGRVGVPGRDVRAYGLTGVLTYPAERHQGYGRRVVQAATAYIDTTDADFAIVNCAPHLRDFYAACGWMPMIDT